MSAPRNLTRPPEEGTRISHFPISTSLRIGYTYLTFFFIFPRLCFRIEINRCWQTSAVSELCCYLQSHVSSKLFLGARWKTPILDLALKVQSSKKKNISLVWIGSSTIFQCLTAEAYELSVFSSEACGEKKIVKLIVSEFARHFFVWVSFFAVEKHRQNLT